MSRDFVKSQLLLKDSIINGHVIDRTISLTPTETVYAATRRDFPRSVWLFEYHPKTLARRTADGFLAPLAGWLKTPFDNSLAAFWADSYFLAQGHLAGTAQVLDYFQASNGNYYRIIPHYEGKILSDLLRGLPQGKMSEDELWPWLEPLIQAMADNYKKGVWRHDLSPDNLLALNSGGLVLLSPRTADQVLTDNISYNALAGARPKAQVEGQIVSPADVYALGALVFHCLSGVAPIALSVRRFANDYDEPDPLRLVFDSLARELAPETLKLLESALEIEPDRRLIDIFQFLRDGSEPERPVTPAVAAPSGGLLANSTSPPSRPQPAESRPAYSRTSVVSPEKALTEREMLYSAFIQSNSDYYLDKFAQSDLEEKRVFSLVPALLAPFWAPARQLYPQSVAIFSLFLGLGFFYGFGSEFNALVIFGLVYVIMAIFTGFSAVRWVRNKADLAIGKAEVESGGDFRKTVEILEGLGGLSALVILFVVADVLGFVLVQLYFPLHSLTTSRNIDRPLAQVADSASPVQPEAPPVPSQPVSSATINAGPGAQPKKPARSQSGELGRVPEEPFPENFVFDSSSECLGRALALPFQVRGYFSEECIESGDLPCVLSLRDQAGALVLADLVMAPGVTQDLTHLGEEGSLVELTVQGRQYRLSKYFDASLCLRDNLVLFGRRLEPTKPLSHQAISVLASQIKALVESGAFLLEGDSQPEVVAIHKMFLESAPFNVGDETIFPVLISYVHDSQKTIAKLRQYPEEDLRLIRDQLKKRIDTDSLSFIQYRNNYKFLNILNDLIGENKYDTVLVGKLGQSLPRDPNSEYVNSTSYQFYLDNGQQIIIDIDFYETIDYRNNIDNDDNDNYVTIYIIKSNNRNFIGRIEY
ncbi:MAG: hypothetical protein LBR11_06115 [Deltaproteobacteria bacterium]|jgi:serine/threonine protein kinase|nr:hypothetical protein [Deltaproteobacteria bacterium]